MRVNERYTEIKEERYGERRKRGIKRVRVCVKEREEREV